MSGKKKKSNKQGTEKEHIAERAGAISTSEKEGEKQGADLHANLP
jgi:hypothetical protein